MAKLFIFGIGGTGSRVLRSLTFLLASGVKINADKIIPIIIDPDQSNGDLNRTYDILKTYHGIRNEMGPGSDSNFFSIEMSSLGELGEKNQGIGDYRLLIKDADNKLFNKFIEHGSLDNSNKDFISLLFSEQNLNSSMDIGFKGNPNIGSVVLNQLFTQNESALRLFASNFQQDDRIFIISSIFGGTGAAGFPLVLKNLRNISSLNNNFANTAYIEKARIGALTVLPYFGVKPSDDNLIDKSSFISKTRAALKYYNRTINKQVNALYYIGDSINKDYENNPGASDQKNIAHFVELAGALSIVDFMNYPVNSNFENGNLFREFGISDFSDFVTFKNLEKDSIQTVVVKPMAKLMLLKKYLDNQYENANKHQPWAKNGKVKLGGANIKDLNHFLNSFEEWLNELSKNIIPFSPFNLSLKGNLKDLIYDRPGNSKSFKGFDHFVEFDRILNKEERKIKNNNTYSKLLELFDISTEKLFNKVY